MFEQIKALPQEWVEWDGTKDSDEKIPQVCAHSSKLSGYHLILVHDNFMLEDLTPPIRSKQSERAGFKRKRGREYLYPGYADGKKCFFRWALEEWICEKVTTPQETQWVELLSFQEGLNYYFSIAEPGISDWLFEKLEESNG